MRQTTHYHLNLPDGDDTYDIQNHNDNMNTIDTMLHTADEKAGNASIIANKVNQKLNSKSIYINSLGEIVTTALVESGDSMTYKETNLGRTGSLASMVQFTEDDGNKKYLDTKITEMVADIKNVDIYTLEDGSMIFYNSCRNPSDKRFGYKVINDYNNLINKPDSSGGGGGVVELNIDGAKLRELVNEGYSAISDSENYKFIPIHLTDENTFTDYTLTDVATAIESGKTIKIVSKETMPDNSELIDTAIAYGMYVNNNGMQKTATFFVCMDLMNGDVYMFNIHLNVGN